MSGPITAGYILVHGVLSICARAYAEARAVKAEYADVLARLQAQQRDLAHARDQQQAARLERVAALHRRAQLQAARVARMRAVAQDLGLSVGPALAAPATQDDAAWSAYATSLEVAAHALDTALAQSGRAHAARLRAALAQGQRAPTIDDVLAGYALQRSLMPGLDAAQTARLQATAARVLGRLELTEGAAIPAALEALARAIVLAPSIDRAEALATELRLGVQRANEMRARQARDADTARKLLSELEDGAPAALVAALERVAAGVDPLDDALRADVERLLATAAADRERADQEAAAQVLEQSLRDLGYEVEDIRSTLFVDGGTVNFRRAGWDRYFVRLRVSAEERTVNFNVVRARGDEETAERRRLDALAEDRWCAEFPALMRTLAARGLSLDVTRRLGAGEVPVQVVDPSTVPSIRDDGEAAPERPALKQRAP